MEEKNRLIISGKGILEATKKGTRKYDNGILVDSGEVVYRVENHNIICNEGLILVAGFAVDESAVYDVGITYCEIGTSSTAPAAGDTTLTAYHGRKAITSASRTNYEDTFATFFTAAQSTCAIEEAGMWGGSNAAAGEATGLLFSHFLVSFDNSAGLYDITVTYVLTVARG
jgi:hypothetical protein